MTTLITGAANGLGQALAVKLNEQNHQLVLVDIDEVSLKRLSDSLKNALPYVVDVTNEAKVRMMAEDLSAKSINLDVIINNAGVGIYQSLINMPLTDWQKQLDVNLTGPFLVNKYLAPMLVRSGQGKIINIGSRMSYTFALERSAYCASKFGLKGLSLCLGEEMKEHNVQVTIIEPDSILTNFRQELSAKEARAAQGELFLQPNEVAHFVSEIIAEKQDWHNEFKLLASGSGMHVEFVDNTPI